MWLKLWCRRKKRTTEHVAGKFGAVGKKDVPNSWLENFGADGKNSCRTRGWKILVPSEKKNCRTRDWKILVLLEKTTAEHVVGKCWCRQKKRTAKHVTGKFWYRRKKRTAEHVTGKVVPSENSEHVAEKVTCLWEKCLCSTKPNRKLLHNVYQPGMWKRKLEAVHFQWKQKRENPTASVSI